MTPTLFYIQLKNTQIIAQFFMISKNFIIIISTLPLKKMFPIWASHKDTNDYYFKVHEKLCNI